MKSHLVGRHWNFLLVFISFVSTFFYLAFIFSTLNLDSSSLYDAGKLIKLKIIFIFSYQIKVHVMLNQVGYRLYFYTSNHSFMMCVIHIVINVTRFEILFGRWNIIFVIEGYIASKTEKWKGFICDAEKIFCWRGSIRCYKRAEYHFSWKDLNLCHYFLEFLTFLKLVLRAGKFN